jgi:hypothetical protein
MACCYCGAEVVALPGEEAFRAGRPVGVVNVMEDVPKTDYRAFPFHRRTTLVCWREIVPFRNCEGAFAALILCVHRGRTGLRNDSWARLPLGVDAFPDCVGLVASKEVAAAQHQVGHWEGHLDHRTEPSSCRSLKNLINPMNNAHNSLISLT